MSPVDLDNEVITVSAPGQSEYDAAWSLEVPALRARILGKEPSRWHQLRAESVGRAPSAKVADCGRQIGWLHCECKRIPMVNRCNVRDRCDDCRKRWSKQTYAKCVKAIQARTVEERWLYERRGYRKGERPMLAMLTLTLADSGDLAGDEAKLKGAWHDWRSWLYQHLGRTWPYELRVEITPGAEGRGHVHLHAVCILPFVDFSAARDAWMRAVERKGGSSCQWHITTRGTNAEDMRKAARYLAKYTSKGEEVRHVPALAAGWRAAHYGKRTTTTSRGWRFAVAGPPPACTSCSSWWEPYWGGMRDDYGEDAAEWRAFLGAT